MLPLPLPPYSIRNINFEGPIVRVVMTYISGTTQLMANIYFDDCGCTGSFGCLAYGWFRENVNPPTYDYDWFSSATGTNWDNGHIQFTSSILSNPDLEFPEGGTYNGFKVSTGTASTFRSECAGIYDFSYNISFGVKGGSNHNCVTIDFDYEATLYVGNYNLGTKTASYFSDFCGAGSDTVGGITSTWTGTIPNFFLQTGEELLIRIEFTVNNHGDSLDSSFLNGEPLKFLANMQGGQGLLGQPNPGTIFQMLS